MPTERSNEIYEVQYVSEIVLTVATTTTCGRLRSVLQCFLFGNLHPHARPSLKRHTRRLYLPRKLPREYIHSPTG